jgi:lipopolysaccharide transport system ATP-binding protein
MASPMSSDPVISLHGVGKAYHVYRRPQDRLKQMLFGRFGRHYEQSYWALQDIDLEVRRGETVGLIGRNGAGKSTLLEIVCGTLTPTHGEVRVEGRIAAMIELGAGFNPDFTGRENTRLSAAVLGLSAAQIEARLPSIIEFAGIGDFIDQPIKLYSSGMYARLAFAVAAHVDADILVVDEILSVGDAAFGQKCMRFINEFKKQGTMLFVSHDIGAVVNLCDRVVWFERGGIRANGPAKDVTAQYLAATAQEADDPSNFRIGGRRRPPSAELFPIPLPQPGPAPRFMFTPDLPRAVPAQASITEVSLRDASGSVQPTYVGGDTVMLVIGYRVLGSCKNYVVAFEWRDRLGQLLFADDTVLASASSDDLASGGIMAAQFIFDLPNLQRGEYVISAAVLHEGPAGYLIDDYQLDAHVVYVSHQVSFGLAGANAYAVDLRVFSE